MDGFPNERAVTERIGIVAGGGSLPMIVAKAARERGMDPIFARFSDGITNGSIEGPSRAFTWGEVGDAIEWLRREKVTKLVMCGTISSRPDFRSVLPSLRTLASLPAMFAITRGGDDSMLRKGSRFLEGKGFELLPVQEIAPRLLAPEGLLTSRAPNDAERAALRKAHRAAVTLGALDAGQAVVASNERIIAMEGIEGTRDMMQRVAELRAVRKIGRAEKLALVKALKPGQDQRFDLPSIGIMTIEEAVAAGITSIGVSALGSLIIGFEDVLDAANRAGIALTGLSTNDVQDGARA
ncbi:UDP-2,3-diacylglucosamine diphosphatase LpxI [Fulvimarina sp. 2208YS6-2-32]|uniref:UDP-2,3-diacylglucosamine diphosphatase LpxI n=1 Tax=Fulvimarina uroteuthidis TaxID=3098149 RepID=A0ABU5I308_9HYPH|nr:UDP-2,3-diacylglucosamine diphosphatase LpxI [Fulvimarina sp. 2208YS6-2-32]MDY8109738.1 UDP-2,3-diacylglucosamine diphosphatase LpxI [Fulvimarina sp. 2208YS6-2-32]